MASPLQAQEEGAVRLHGGQVGNHLQLVQEEPAVACWCGEKKAGETKHRRAGEEACEASKADRRAYDRQRDKEYERKRNKVRTEMARWKPGTSILVEEIEEL